MTYSPAPKLIELKDKVLRYAEQDFWDDPENLHDIITDLADEWLIMEPGQPATQNLAWLISQGVRVEIVNKPDKDFPDFWYGEVYISGPYNITFKSRGQTFSGI